MARSTAPTRREPLSRLEQEPPSPTALESVVFGILKLFGSGVVFVVFVGVGAAAGLTVSGWECDGSSGGMSFSGCGSERGALGWMVFAEFVGIGIALAVAILIPRRWRRLVTRGEGAALRLTLIALAVLILPLLFTAGRV